MNRKKAALIAIITLGICLVAGLLYMRQPFLHTLTVQYSASPGQNVEVELYSTEPTEQDESRTLKDKVRTISDNETALLLKGVYALRTVGENYQENIQYINLEDSSQEFKYILQYTPEELSRLQAQEEDSVYAAITKEYPDASALYDNPKDEMLGQGEWYIALLHYKGDSGTMRDTLRIVLHKDNDEWQLKTKPRIVLSAADYPDIPPEVLTQANKPLPDPAEKQY